MSSNWTITNSILCNCLDSQNCIKIKGIKFPVLCLHKSFSVDQFEKIIGSPFLIDHNIIQLIGIALILLLQFVLIALLIYRQRLIPNPLPSSSQPNEQSSPAEIPLIPLGIEIRAGEIEKRLDQIEQIRNKEYFDNMNALKRIENQIRQESISSSNSCGINRQLPLGRPLIVDSRPSMTSSRSQNLPRIEEESTI